MARFVSVQSERVPGKKGPIGVVLRFPTDQRGPLLRNGIVKFLDNPPPPSRRRQVAGAGCTHRDNGRPVGLETAVRSVANSAR